MGFVITLVNKCGTLLYCPSSTLFGSTITIFTSSGFALTNKEVTIELIQDDLPAPVCPAISTCGNSDKLTSRAVPDISKPNPTDKGCALFLASGDCKTSPNETSLRCLLGISIPIALLPGIGASKRTSGVAKA